jgi:hypothetical protein
VSWFSRFLGKAGSDEDEPIVVVPIPPLVTLLQQYETAKGSPLKEEEVLGIRGKAVCMTVRRSQADQLAENRGFPDIDPANVWEEWVCVRSQGSA